jgi:hypothetical protein
MYAQIYDFFERVLANQNSYALICPTEQAAADAWALLEVLSRDHATTYPPGVRMVELENGSKIRVFRQGEGWFLFNPLDCFQVKIYWVPEADPQPRFGL